MSSNQWTWLSGSNTSDQSGVYGAQGVPSPLHSPGARNGHSMSLDSARGLLYVFGGRLLKISAYGMIKNIKNS